MLKSYYINCILYCNDKIVSVQHLRGMYYEEKVQQYNGELVQTGNGFDSLWNYLSRVKSKITTAQLITHKKSKKRKIHFDRWSDMNEPFRRTTIKEKSKKPIQWKFCMRFTPKETTILDLLTLSPDGFLEYYQQSLDNTSEQNNIEKQVGSRELGE